MQSTSRINFHQHYPELMRQLETNLTMTVNSLVGRSPYGENYTPAQLANLFEKYILKESTNLSEWSKIRFNSSSVSCSVFLLHNMYRSPEAHGNCNMTDKK